jgi:hypothetical protein
MDVASLLHSLTLLSLDQLNCGATHIRCTPYTQPRTHRVIVPYLPAAPLTTLRTGETSRVLIQHTTYHCE